MKVYGRGFRVEDSGILDWWGGEGQLGGTVHGPPSSAERTNQKSSLAFNLRMTKIPVMTVSLCSESLDSGSTDHTTGI